MWPPRPTRKRTDRTAKRQIDRNCQMPKTNRKAVPRVTEDAPLGERVATATGWSPGQDFPVELAASPELSLVEGVARTLARQR